MGWDRVCGELMDYGVPITHLTKVSPESHKHEDFPGSVET